MRHTKTSRLLFAALVGVFMFASVGSAFAAQIVNPNAAYLASTTKIPNDASVSDTQRRIDDGTLLILAPSPQFLSLYNGTRFDWFGEPAQVWGTAGEVEDPDVDMMWMPTGGGLVRKPQRHSRSSLHPL